MIPFVQLKSISKRFGGVRALDSVDLQLEPGEVHCIAGENGSGKSTLIKIISGILPPNPGGQIVIEGVEHTRLTPTQSTKLGIQVIYQDLSLFPNLTVAENIGLAQHMGLPHLVKWRMIRTVAETAMAKIGVSLDLDAKIESLSIGSRQLVAICRALAQDVRLVIMDEPTASLASHEVAALLRLILELKRRNIIVVFVSHKLDEVLEVSDRVTVLRDGVCVGTFSAADMDSKRLAFLMTGKQFHYDLKPLETAYAPTVLAASGLTRRGDYENVSFELRRGEILGITGLLGSGRTELALSLFGITAPDAGEIRLDGQPVTIRSNQDAIRQGIAYVSEDRLALGLILDQPISANVLITVLDKVTGSLGMVDRTKRDQLVGAWIQNLSIKVSDPENPVRTLSGGNQQRVVLAKWLACGPRVLILDSPTVGVDINAKDGIYDLITKLAETGVAIILISDEIPEVLYHTSRILIMKGGRVASEFLAHETSETELAEAVNA